jgi:arsenate reductase (thioredoxin)
MNYLFICNGNVARSQEAEVFFNAKKTAEMDTVQSAGINVKLGKPIDPLVVEVMNEVGYDVSDAERKLLTEDMVTVADKVISFKPVEELPDYLQIRKADIELWEVPDPQHQPIEFHRKVRDDISARVLALISQ